MTRRTVAVVGALCAWSLTSAAMAQTTTTSTSSSTSSTSTSTTSTSSTSTTSTTIANPCAGQPCTNEPPQAFLSGSNGEVRIDGVGYCWRSPAPNAQGFFTALCADGIGRPPEARLRVQAGETLTLGFSAMSPTAVSYSAGGDSVPLTPGNPARFVADFPIGSTPVVLFFTKWLQGDATYAVQLDVRAAPRPIALTG